MRICLFAATIVAILASSSSQDVTTDTGLETEIPTDAPTETPTEAPIETPTETPTEVPIETPTETPTEVPTETPTETPTEFATDPTDTVVVTDIGIDYPALTGAPTDATIDQVDTGTVLNTVPTELVGADTDVIVDEVIQPVVLDDINILTMTDTNGAQNGNENTDDTQTLDDVLGDFDPWDLNPDKLNQIQKVLADLQGDDTVNYDDGPITSSPTTEATTTEIPTTLNPEPIIRWMNRMMYAKPRKCEIPWVAYEKARKQGKSYNNCNRRTTECPPLYRENRGNFFL